MKVNRIFETHFAIKKIFPYNSGVNELRESTGQKIFLQKNSLYPHTSELLVQTLFSVSL